uniref:Ig-like domain-containing protein n=1 Tax=Macrostomum lignano TaxID=282301 RepID=A0A1I8I266_9PLAT
GQWLAAAPVGSPVSAVGASSLPLELQLEDPCDASWETYGSSDRWRQLNVQVPVSFILLKNSSGDLQWSALNLTGRPACLQLLDVDTPMCASLDNIGKSSVGDPICFSVRDCGLKTTSSRLNCSIRNRNGKQFRVNHQMFEFKSSLEHQGALLSCSRGHQQEARLERMLLLRIPPIQSDISPPAVLVSGRTASVSFITTDSSPEPRHVCWIGASSSNAPSSQAEVLTAAAIERKITLNSENLPVFSVKSTFTFTVSKWMKANYINCKESFATTGSVTSVVKRHSITAISEPCVTRIEFEQAEFWREHEVRTVRVRSDSCSFWPVSHSCWLIDSAVPFSQLLKKVQSTDFSSEHQLRVSRWMARSRWLVRCQVNQSGVEYPDVETSANQLPALNDRNMSVMVTKADSGWNVSDVQCTADFGGNTSVQNMKQKSTQRWELAKIPLALLWSSIFVRIQCSGRQTFRGTAVYNISRSEAFLTLKPEASNESDPNASKRTQVVFIFRVVTLAIGVLMVGAIVVYLWFRNVPNSTGSFCQPTPRAGRCAGQAQVNGQKELTAAWVVAQAQVQQTSPADLMLESQRALQLRNPSQDDTYYEDPDEYWEITIRDMQGLYHTDIREVTLALSGHGCLAGYNYLQIWLLLPALLSLRVSSAEAQCTDAKHKVTVQLSRADVLRTWQPSGAHCRWWKSRQSETNRFPAVVRSGPRWLVMQLRQPMMLETVSVRDWDGQWLAAAPVGSSVSAVGASSLPLELQLENPCDASWETYGSSDRWRQLNVQVPVSFILLKNSSGDLQWSALNLTGRPACLQLLDVDTQICASLDNIGKSSVGDPICFSVRDCGLKTTSSRLNCSIRNRNGKQFRVNHSEISPPAVLVSGRTASVSFITTDSSPEPRHLCWIGASSSNAPSSQAEVLTAAAIERKITWNSENLPVFSVKSTFTFTVSKWMKANYINCKESFATTGSVTSVVKRHSITAISEPCVTRIEFEQAEFWREHEVRTVRVRSDSCSFWPVSHSCWLIDSAVPFSQLLKKVQNTDFNSEHQLRVSRWMARSRWLVRCQVNQSGVEYPDVETSANQLPALNDRNMSVMVTKADSGWNVSDVQCTADFGGNTSVQNMKQTSTQRWELAKIPLALLRSSISVRIQCSGRQTFRGTTAYNISRSETFPFTLKPEASNESDPNAPRRTYAAVAIGAVSLLLSVFILVVTGVCLYVTTKQATSSYSVGQTQLADLAGSIPQADCSDGQSEQQTSSKPAIEFAKVLQIIDQVTDQYDASSGSDSEDSNSDSLMFTTASGHYDLDGCTFVKYKEYYKDSSSKPIPIPESATSIN